MIAKGRILIVDDDEMARESLCNWFEGEGYEVEAVAGGEQALAAAARQRWDVVLADVRMPGMDGMELLRRLRGLYPELPVIMVTAYASVETAVRCLKTGAQDYIAKPFQLAGLSSRVERALEQSRSQRDLERLGNKLQEVSPKTELVGQSAAMARVIEQVETVAQTEAPVLITGERGSGKEIVARAIHAGSPRSHMPMAMLRCGALNEALLESELFGHEPGVVEGAQYRKKGKLEIADGGTLFLDEIGEVSPKVQTDLLNVFETGEVIRLGGGHSIRVDNRWVAATNTSLDVRVVDGRFRPELFYRLNVFSIELPRLRERREDIPLLVDHFLRKHAAAMNRAVPSVSKAAMDLLLGYDWPGNIRELENAVERALLISSDNEIQTTNFPFQRKAERLDQGQTLQEVERRHIEKTVERNNWNLSRSARMLGIDRTTLYNKLRKYGLK